MVKLFPDQWEKKNGEKPDMNWHNLMRTAEPKELTLIRARFFRESDKWVYPPSILRFKTLLREARIERAGLPLPTAAFAQAKRRDWSAGATYETARRVGLGDLLGSAYVSVKPDSEMMARWVSVYGAVCDEVLQGAVFKGPLSGVDPALPERLPVTAEDRARVRPALDALRKQFGLKPRSLD